MAKSGAARVKESRGRHPEKVRLEMIVSAEVKERFASLVSRYRLTNGEMLERLIDALSLDGADAARKILAECGGDEEKARAVYQGNRSSVS